MRVSEYEVESTRERQLAAEQAAAHARQPNSRRRRRRSSQFEQQLAALQAATTEKQIAAAKCEQRVEMLRAQLEQAQRDQRERDDALADMRRRLADRQTQLAELDAAMLAARQSLAELFLVKQQQAAELAAAGRRRRAVSRARAGTPRTRPPGSPAARRPPIATPQARHRHQQTPPRTPDARRADARRLRHRPAQQARRTSVASRERGHLGRNATPSNAKSPNSATSSTSSARSTSTRSTNSTSSNRASAASRSSTATWSTPRPSLERIIQRINVDSRQLFLATLETVRGHFRELYRRLFGGGEADILLDDAEDVLEGGIDIVACPPGKEACSISLLSGGEKTLTCVALLLAVFRSKPSPFCILDEVDAALDEANIGRFIQVLREFLSFTQFVVVTHSKKTMAGADTLYGITMEESGVSKHVSVRFEDVSEDGQINLRNENRCRRCRMTQSTAIEQHRHS